MEKPKQWWTPVWTGLVIDRQAKHYRKMKTALWLFLYLLVNAHRQTGQLMRKLNTISTDMGMSRDTVLRWLSSLRQGGYIETRNTGRCLHIQITKWRSPAPTRSSPLLQTQAAQLSSGISITPDPRQKPVKTAPGRQEPANEPKSNDRSIKKHLLKIDLEDKFRKARIASANQFFPQTREQLLALDLAQGLNDQAGLPLYLSYAKRFPESDLRAIMGAVREIPVGQIKKSRGALFNHLVQKKYAKQPKDSSGCEPRIKIPRHRRLSRPDLG
jgi:hypothetical protein